MQTVVTKNNILDNIYNNIFKYILKIRQYPMKDLKKHKGDIYNTYEIWKHIDK